MTPDRYPGELQSKSSTHVELSLALLSTLAKPEIKKNVTSRINLVNEQNLQLILGLAQLDQLEM